MSKDAEKGFTLVELLVALVIALILLAGLYSNFIMQSRVQNSQAERTTSSEDLQIASQIIQRELRMAKNDAAFACAGKVISYTDVDGNPGSFEYQKTGHRSDEICWDIPNKAGGCQELIRNLDKTTGMQLALIGGAPNKVCQVTLLGSYMDHNHVTKTWQTAFKVSPRN